MALPKALAGACCAIEFMGCLDGVACFAGVGYLYGLVIDQPLGKSDLMLKNLADVLTKNPLVIVGMFLFTVITGACGFLLGWEVLYRDFLSKSVTVPAWVALLVVFAALVLWVVYGTRNKTQPNAPLVLVADKKFGVQQVNVSGKNFLGCEFHGTEIIFDGESLFGFDRCEFLDPRFTFVGPAGRALMTLADLFKDPSFRPVVEGVILNIRTGQLPIAVKPSLD